MSPSDVNTASYADLVREALDYIQLNARIILLSAGTAVLAALLVAHYTPLQYRASVMVAAQEGLSTSGNLGSFQDIAALTGGGPSGGPFQPFERFAQTITNLDVAKQAANQSWVLPAFFPDQWNAKTHSWHETRGVIAVLKRGVKSFMGLPAWRPPGANELRRVLGLSVSVDKFGRNPAYTISFEWGDPAVAARVLSLLLKTNDTIIQRDAQTRLKSTIAYLQGRLEGEAEVNRSNALHQLLLEQERSLMAAGASGPYAAKIIDSMSTTAVALRKLELAAISFLLVFLLTFGVFKLGQRLQRDKNLRAARMSHTAR